MGICFHTATGTVEVGFVLIFGPNSWDDATIAERYSGDVGEEYKDRLGAKIEGKEYVPTVKPAPTSQSFSNNSASSNSNSRSQTPLGSRTESPRPDRTGKTKVDDKYFAGLGAANANRSADLPPSQGGKYAGFGSAGPMKKEEDAALPGFNDLQKDPVAALTKGFGWFTTTVTKTAKTVNDGYIQPTAAKVVPPPLISHLPTLIPIPTPTKIPTYMYTNRSQKQTSQPKHESPPQT